MADILSQGAPPLVLQDASVGPYTDRYHEESTSDSSLETRQEQVWQELDRFYADNEQAIKKAAAMRIDSGIDPSNLSASIDGFVETASVILDGLVALGNVHPILGVAIFAFHSVISLDLARRDNNRKVNAVKLQMQNMMCTMFQLRKLKHVHVQDERDEQRAQLQRLVKAIAEDITSCGSDLNYYMDRRFVSKLIRSKIYERRFADHIATFAERRSELQSMITSYISAGVDAANIAIAEVGLKVDRMDNKLDAMFRKLDTPREHDAITFVEANGGARNCVTRDELLVKLLSKAGEISPDTKNTAFSQDELFTVQKMLVMELAQNLEEALAQNQFRFEKLLNVQNKNLERISDQIEQHGHNMQDHNMKLDKLVSTSLLILEEGKIIKKAVFPNTSVKVKDPELQQIWDRMGLKRNVKAKHFVLTFRDYLLTDRSTPSTPYPAPTILHHEPSTLLMSSHIVGPEKQSSTHLSEEVDADGWLLKYIDASHVYSIVEAMDEDGSGFISVKEANKFALSRPRELSLLHWIAYWAAGWHINLISYREKIYSILHQIHQAVNAAHVTNRAYADFYLNHYTMSRVEGLVRTIKPLPGNTPKDSKLTEIAESVASLQEQRILSNLSEMSYTIKSQSDVTLIAGLGRVETWILPLLYLLLTRHLEILKVGQTVVLKNNELSGHTASLMSIFSVFEERTAQLEAIFRQMYRDVEAQFQNHSYGLFLSFFKKDHAPSKNILFTVEDTKVQPISNPVANPEKLPDTSILVQGAGPTLQHEEFVVTPSVQSPENSPHPIEGLWVGICYVKQAPQYATQGAFSIVIDHVVDNKISGKGENFTQVVEFEGQVISPDDSDPLGPIVVVFRVSWPDSDYEDIWCKGQYDAENETIQGAWVVPDLSSDSEGEKEVSPFVDGEAQTAFETMFKNADSDSDTGLLYLTKGSLDAFRFKHLLLDPGPDSAWNLSRKRWAFAIEAVLFQTRGRMNSSAFWRARMDERKRWTKLSALDSLDQDQTSGKRCISDEEIAEYDLLMKCIHPSNARLFEGIAAYLFSRLSYYTGNFACDVCNQTIMFTRFTCITCVEEDMSNQIDMCPGCIDSRVFNRERRFVHHLSHTLIRFVRRDHYCERASILPQARLRSERIKTSFRASEMKTANTKTTKTSDSRGTKGSYADNLVTSRKSLTPLICACCSKSLTLPCWACITCVVDTLLCMECERNRKTVPIREGVPSLHLHHHTLMRINLSEEVKIGELKETHLETQLANMEARINNEINEGLSGLEQKVNLQLVEMKDVVNEVGKKFGQVIRETTPALEQATQDSVVLRTTGDVSLSHDRIGGSDVKLLERLDDVQVQLQQRLERLETKVDTQFAHIVSMMQELMSATRPSQRTDD